MVDVESFVDLILINYYVGNWDFMNNNFRMWKSQTVDPTNPYADGRWRFLAHDLDVGFDFWDESKIDTYRKLNPGSPAGTTYFDWYVGKWPVNGYDSCKLENHILLLAPMHNPEFRSLLKERMPYIAGLFATPDDLDKIQNEYSPYMTDYIKRWGWQWRENISAWEARMTQLKNNQESRKTTYQAGLDAIIDFFEKQ